MCGRFALGRDRDAVLEEAIHAFQRGMNGPRHNRDHRNNQQEEPRDENDDADEEEENWDGDAPIEWIDRDDFHPRYNIAPRTRAPVLRVEVQRASAEDQSVGKKRQVLQTMVWFSFR
jgi:putative SOS response-associated peptidase YedK